jgi:hypothetical protein
VDNRNSPVIQSAIYAVQTMLSTVHRLTLELNSVFRYSASVAEAVPSGDGKLGA